MILKDALSHNCERWCVTWLQMTLSHDCERRCLIIAKDAESHDCERRCVSWLWKTLCLMIAIDAARRCWRFKSFCGLMLGSALNYDGNASRREKWEKKLRLLSLCVINHFVEKRIYHLNFLRLCIHIQHQNVQRFEQEWILFAHFSIGLFSANFNKIL